LLSELFQSLNTKYIFQDPKHLATANFQRSKEEKVEDEMALLKVRNQEQEKKKQRFYQVRFL
jgi:hypothetical protein